MSVKFLKCIFFKLIANFKYLKEYSIQVIYITLIHKSHNSDDDFKKGQSEANRLSLRLILSQTPFELFIVTNFQGL